MTFDEYWNSLDNILRNALFYKSHVEAVWQAGYDEAVRATATRCAEIANEALDDEYRNDEDEWWEYNFNVADAIKKEFNL